MSKNKELGAIPDQVASPCGEQPSPALSATAALARDARWSCEWMAETADWVVWGAKTHDGDTYSQPAVCTLGDFVGEDIAHLISAAPELLEEAREICAILDMYRADTGEEPCFDHEAIGEEIARRHDSLTAALAKAQGVQS